MLKKFKLNIPLGQDGAPDVRPSVMGAFQTRGTPWTIIIDLDGIIRHSDFRITVEQATRLIDRFDEEKPVNQKEEKNTADKAEKK